ncbi:hypothetical protein M1N93_02795, partial [Dehalococcoidia bacterium]|nr:hypothetical protein [Dehalococcoidia bacterium]
MQMELLRRLAEAPGIPRVLIAQRVVVHSDSGDHIGVMGTKPVHVLKEEEKKKAPEMEDIFIDLGI